MERSLFLLQDLWNNVFYSNEHLWVLEKNANAIRFYEAHGFHITGNKMLEEGTAEYKVMMER